MYDTLKKIAETDCIVEVNTGGIARKKISSLYPSTWILDMCKHLKIPLTLNSDAHKPVKLRGLCWISVIKNFLFTGIPNGNLVDLHQRDLTYDT